MADQDENINVLGRKRGFRNGVGVLACAVLLALTSLSGCRVYVVGSTPPNPFLGEWHAEFTSAGRRDSFEYEFERDGSYSYISESASGAGAISVEIQGTYDYDDETLILKPKSSRFPPSRLKYEFKSDNELELESRIDTGYTVRLTYHRHP